MIETKLFCFFAVNPSGGVTVFKADICECSLDGIVSNLGRIMRSSMTDTQYDASHRTAARMMVRPMYLHGDEIQRQTAALNVVMTNLLGFRRSPFSRCDPVAGRQSITLAGRLARPIDGLGLGRAKLCCSCWRFNRRDVGGEPIACAAICKAD
ncbi:hypothetical protein [Paraburkholderia youngii]|uniref:hypothetical protein n=1 Tax=Paraburkholderia youngii TaxID=2782701 RepID=UPI0020CD60AF|nr:hypothetical protein [Paraburkholderia youngii]